MSICENIEELQKQIELVEAEEKRPKGSVTLLAVSKGMASSAIREAYAAGIRNFAENYVQEALLKMQDLQDLDIIWHFIGPIQSNKCKEIAKNFSWVHSLCRSKIAEALHSARPSHLPALKVCLQINFDEEHIKSGLDPQKAIELAQFVEGLANLELCGLMMIPKIEIIEQNQYASFLRLRTLMSHINTELKLSLQSLSMGMTDDWKAAIRAGSTLIRIGRAIFGARS